MFGLVVRFTCKDQASAKAFDRLVAATVDKIRTDEPGTLVYAVNRVDGEPLQRIFYELYRDRAGFDAHEEQEHTKKHKVQNVVLFFVFSCSLCSKVIYTVILARAIDCFYIT